MEEDQATLLETRFVTAEGALTCASEKEAVRLFCSNEDVNAFMKFIATTTNAASTGCSECVLRLQHQDAFLGCPTQGAMTKAEDEEAEMAQRRISQLTQKQF
ncbi:hypothetical protein MRX96_006149 [Rhipicephalus microplus]